MIDNIAKDIIKPMNELLNIDTPSIRASKLLEKKEDKISKLFKYHHWCYSSENKIFKMLNRNFDNIKNIPDKYKKLLTIKVFIKLYIANYLGNYLFNKLHSNKYDIGYIFKKIIKNKKVTEEEYAYAENQINEFIYHIVTQKMEYLQYIPDNLRSFIKLKLI